MSVSRSNGLLLAKEASVRMSTSMIVTTSLKISSFCTKGSRKGWQ